MTRSSETSMSNEQRRATAFRLSSRDSWASRNYARVPGYKKKYKKKTRKRREKKRKMNGVEINTRAYVATRLLLPWDYLYAVTLKTKVFGDYNHARLEVSWITSTRGLLLRGYTGIWSAPRIDHDDTNTHTHTYTHLLVACGAPRPRFRGAKIAKVSHRPHSHLLIDKFAIVVFSRIFLSSLYT